MKRLYELIVGQHFKENAQMLFMAGPRQVGKTTLAKLACSTWFPSTYLNFDRENDRKIIFQGEDALIDKLNFQAVHKMPPLLVLDEFHKYKYWKKFLKGFYDQYKSKINILVTGSAKLNIYKAGGDSLMGRYLLYRIHPLSIAEILAQPITANLTNPPKKINSVKLNRLMHFGGYPEPFIKNNQRFLLQWRRLRQQQLFREDIRDLKQIQDLPHIEMLAILLRQQAGKLVNYSNLAKAIRVSVDTIIRWINILEEFYYCFRIKPWHKNIKRSLVKEPKIYLWNWAELDNPGDKVENLVASHLHKATHFWTDYGLGKFELYYLRDKDKQEVDFLVTRDDTPWFLVEAKNSANRSISKQLYYFKQQTNAPHAFQIALNKPFVDKDCFTYTDPVITPLTTLLSQLV